MRGRTLARFLANNSQVDKPDKSLPTDVVLPSQFFGNTDIGLPDSPEKRLMFAVLLDAIKHLRRRTSTGAIEAEEWIRDDEQDGLFAFSNVCAVLGFEPSALALGLLTETRVIRGVPRHPRASGKHVTPRRRKNIQPVQQTERHLHAVK